LDVQKRHCDGGWRGRRTRSSQADVTRRLSEYAAGYADRKAERA
jgi:hypothetical protein